MSSWLRSTPTIKKSHFYVWYLGSKESDGVRGASAVLPVMRQLLRDSFRRAPHKVTVQLSGKGVKLIQTVPTMTKAGKLKMQLIKFQIPTNSITYSMTGPAPFHDVFGVIVLVLNPEMACPVHVHCYRCDSAETAAIMHANVQILLSRPENQKHIADIERRLFLSGLLMPRRPAEVTNRSNGGRCYRPQSPISHDYTGVPSENDDDYADGDEEEDDEDDDDSLQRCLFNELKDKLKSKQRNKSQPPIATDRSSSPRRRPRPAISHATNRYNKNTSSTSGFGSDVSPVVGRRSRHSMAADFPVWLVQQQQQQQPSIEPPKQLRLFGDTMLPTNKRTQMFRSVDNLVANADHRQQQQQQQMVVAPTPSRFPKSDIVDPFGQKYTRSANVDSFWKSRAKRASSWYLNTPT